MSTVSSSANTLAAPATAAASVQRVVSIDIFRGLTMLVMIFVNDLADVHGLPWWTYHAHAQQDLMTYVDMVFPFFLFIVGMSMPLAIERRLKQNPSYAALWLHIAMRSCGLIVLGLILANAEKVDLARTHMSGPAWALLGLTGGILFWLVPSRDTRHRRIYLALRIAGLLLLIAVFAIFRRTTSDGSVGWIDGSYPEILGLIGYTYFSVALLYVPDATLAVGSARLVRRADRLLRAGSRPSDSLALAPAALHMALQQRGTSGHHHGGHRDFCDPPRIRPQATSAQSNPACVGFRAGNVLCRVAAHAPRHFENPRDTHLASGVFRSGRALLPFALLDLRHEGLDAMGCDRQARRRKHSAHLPAA